MANMDEHGMQEMESSVGKIIGDAMTGRPQPTSTALQIALYELLQSVGLRTGVVLGHSSGEVAAAYASGFLTLESACKVSYFRGKLSTSLKRSKFGTTGGAMMSVDMQEAEMRSYLGTVSKCSHQQKSHIRYHSVVIRQEKADYAFLQLIGDLSTRGYSLDVQKANEISKHLTNTKPQMLVDLPSYPFNHTKRYWYESSLSRHDRIRRHDKHELLGVPVADWNPLELCWRKVFDLTETPWIEHHKVNGKTIYPATGMVVMAIQAAAQLAEDHVRENPNKAISGYEIRDAVFSSPIVIEEEGSITSEAWLHLHPDRSTTDKTADCFEYRLYSATGSNQDAADDAWLEHSCGIIRVIYDKGLKDNQQQSHTHKERTDEDEYYRNRLLSAHESCTLKVPTLDMYANFEANGLAYGPSFRALDELAWDGGNQAVGILRCDTWLASKESQRRYKPHVAHPVTLDAAGQLMWVALTKGAREVVVNGAAVTRELCFEMSYKPDVDLLDRGELLALTAVDSLPDYETNAEAFYGDLELALYCSVTKTLGFLSTLDHDISTNSPPHISKPLVQISRHLPEIITREIQPLELLFSTDSGPSLAENFYAEGLAPYLDAMAHKNPQLRILEVGAGTGSITKHVLLDALRLFSDGNTVNTVPRFARYDYTDISPAYFEAARAKFCSQDPHVEKRMRFKVLDIETPILPNQQEKGAVVVEGPEHEELEESYDLIIAAGVLHATRDLAKKYETQGGWWLGGGSDAMDRADGDGVDEQRKWSPCVDETTWNRILMENGFKGGVDVVIRDYDSPACRESSILVATATEEDAAPPPLAVAAADTVPDAEIMVVLDTDSPLQVEFGNQFQALLRQGPGTSSMIFKLLSLQDHAVTGSGAPQKMDIKTLVFLAELNTSLLARLDKSSFETLQTLLSAARHHVIWVSSSFSPDQSSPATATAETHLIRGLSRVLNTERPNRPFVTLHFDEPITPENLGNSVRQLLRVLSPAIRTTTSPTNTGSSSNAHPTPEFEYIPPAASGLLSIPRVFPSPHLNTEIHTCCHPSLKSRRPPSVSRSQTPQAVVSLCLKIPNPGLLDSLRFEPDPLHSSTPLDAQEIEIQVQAVGVNLRDLLVCLGKLPATTIGCECAGTVTRVEAAGLAITGVTAYLALVKLANLKRGETVLIHSAAGGTGQMALQLAISILGGRTEDVYATVGTPEKRELLTGRYGLWEENIFHSRGTSFRGGILRATDGRGVDVVLNSLSGEGLRASWGCIAPFGRFVEIGRTDMEANNKLGIGRFAQTVSFYGLALDHLMVGRPGVVGDALREVMKMVEDGKLRTAYPLEVYKMGDVETAFRRMQTGRNTGKMVLEWAAEPRHTTTLRGQEDGTYLIAGGLGGLGRSAAEGMPPIRGVLQCTMVLQDSLIENMTYEQWEMTTRSKVDSTGNLYRLLVTGQDKVAALDFFVTLSSSAGIVGTMGQANYAARNTYQDGLASASLPQPNAHVRVTSIDLGLMAEIGIVAENGDLAPRGTETIGGDLAKVSEKEFLALLDLYCRPLDDDYDNVLETARGTTTQPIIGLVSPEMIRARSSADGAPPTPTWLLDRPLLKGLAASSWSDDQQGDVGVKRDAGGRRDWRAEFLQAVVNSPLSSHRDDETNQAGDGNQAAADAVVEAALVDKLSRVTSIPADEIDPARPLHVYGVDSLLAVELRNWFAWEFRADVAILEIIMGYGRWECPLSRWDSSAAEYLRELFLHHVQSGQSLSPRLQDSVRSGDI
ncbi:Polyketide synthase dehydratase domain containing protein [Rhypophila decipiens]